MSRSMMKMVVKYTKRIDMLLRLVVCSFYKVILFFTDIFKDNASPLLAVITGVYVLLTYSVLTETRRQTNIMIESTRPIQRAYLSANIIESNVGMANLHLYPNVNCDGSLKIKLENIGQTPAYILWGYTKIDSLSRLQLNIRDSLLCGNVSTHELPEDWPGMLAMKHEYIFRFNFNVTASNKGRFYLHIYIVYKDVFMDYHDFYSITSCVVDTAQRLTFKFKPQITFDTLNSAEAAFVDSMMSPYIQ